MNKKNNMIEEFLNTQHLACSSAIRNDMGTLVGMENLLKAFVKFQQSQPKPGEFIICAANRYDDGVLRVHSPAGITSGFVTCGRRHHNCINTFSQIVGFPYTEEGHRIHNTEVQGFLTNTNRFVTRKEAYKIAFAANQIKGPNADRPENEIGLTSEDIY